MMDVNNTAQLGSLVRAASATRADTPVSAASSSSATETTLHNTETVRPGNRNQQVNEDPSKKYKQNKSPSPNLGGAVDIYV